MRKELGLPDLALSMILVAITCGCSPTHECSREPHARTHPFVFWDQADIDSALARIVDGSPDQAWARPIHDNIIADAEDWLVEAILVPDEGGGWTMDYVCPTHGVTLRYDPDEPLSHRCPAGGEIWTGEPYDAAWRAYRHNSLSTAIRTLGLAFLLEADEGRGAAFAARARDILLDYALKYPDYEIHSPYGPLFPSAAKAFTQTLDEAVWLLKIVAGYDSIYDSGLLTGDEKDRIEDGLLCFSVNTILRNDAMRSNWQAWHNAALGSVGFLLEDPWLIDRAIDGAHGFEYHMIESVQDDGIWYEGALSYHYYTLNAYRQLSEAALRSGIDLYANTRYKMMFDAPLDTLLPNLEFPRINDVSSSRDSVRSRAPYYEVAKARWNDDLYDWLLDEIYSSGTNRSSPDALLYGRPIDGTASNSLAAANLEASGLAILREGMGADPVYLLMDYGPHGGSHGHPDKLGIILFKGRELLPDMGTVKYTLPQHEGWYRQTLAHNTLMMGEASQLTWGEEIRQVDYFGEPGEGLRAIQATVNSQVFPWGGSATRTLAMVRDDYVVDVVSADKGPAPYDLVYHVYGDAIDTSITAFTDIPAALEASWDGSTAGHAYLEPPSSLDGAAEDHIRQFESSDTWSAVVSSSGDPEKLGIMVPEGPVTTLIVADAPSNPFTAYHPALILRRDGSSMTRYVTILEPFETVPMVTSVTVDGNQIEIRFGAETHTITIDQDERDYHIEFE